MTPGSEVSVSKSPDYPYANYMDVKFRALSLIDVPSLVEACTDPWYNQTLCRVNGSVVRLGILQGEYHWHKHDTDDEFFFTQSISKADVFEHGVKCDGDGDQHAPELISLTFS